MTMNTSKRLLLGSFLLAFLSLPNQMLAMSYSITGKFSYQTFSSEKPGEPIPDPPLLRKFEASVDDTAWKIRVFLVGNSDFDSFIYSYDGTNLLHYFIPSGGKPRLELKYSVTVEESPVPASITSAAGQYVWLAFASGRYFKSQTNNSTLSFDRARSRAGHVRRYERPCRVTALPSPPYLPTSIEYVQTNRGVYLDDDGRLTVEPLPPPFGKSAYTSAVYESSGFTIVADLQFPTHFEYRKYRLKPDARTTKDVSCLLVVSGEVTSISIKRQAIDCALPDLHCMIYDLRVPEPNVLYPIHDSRLPPVNSDIVRFGRERALGILRGGR